MSKTKTTKTTSTTTPAAPTTTNAPVDLAAALAAMQQQFSLLAAALTGTASASAPAATTTPPPPPEPMKPAEPQHHPLHNRKAYTPEGAPCAMVEWTGSKTRKGGICFCVQSNLLLLTEEIGGQGGQTRYFPRVYLFTPQLPSGQEYGKRHNDAPPESIEFADGKTQSTAGMLVNRSLPAPLELQAMSLTTRTVSPESLQASQLARTLDEKTVVFGRVRNGRFERLAKSQWIEYFERLAAHWFTIAPKAETLTLETLSLD
jgi:hypothetical protein